MDKLNVVFEILAHFLAHLVSRLSQPDSIACLCGKNRMNKNEFDYTKNEFVDLENCVKVVHLFGFIRFNSSNDSLADMRSGVL